MDAGAGSELARKAVAATGCIFLVPEFCLAAVSSQFLSRLLCDTNFPATRGKRQEVEKDSEDKLFDVKGLKLPTNEVGQQSDCCCDHSCCEDGNPKTCAQMAAELNAVIRGQISIEGLHMQTYPVPSHIECENCDW
jgi:hypothetical protein